MKRVLFTVVFAVSTLLGTMLRPAAADSITFYFDCNIQGGACDPLVDPVGTLTITDSLTDSNAVDIVLDLVSGSAQQFYMNYANVLTGTIVFSATNLDANQDITYSSDSLQADGYSKSKFDIVIPDNQLGLGNPFSTTLSLTVNGVAVNLNAADFNVLSFGTATPLYAAVQKTQGGAWYGSLTSCTGEDCVQLISEPPSLALFGAALALCGVTLRRRRVDESCGAPQA